MPYPIIDSGKGKYETQSFSIVIGKCFINGVLF